MANNVKKPEENDNFLAFLLNDIVIPSLKRTISDAARAVLDGIRDGIDSYLFNGEKVTSRSSSRHRAYDSYYRGKTTKRTESQDWFGLDDIRFDTILEAKDIRRKAANYIQKYGALSVAVYCDMCDGIVAPSTANNYGWTDMSLIAFSNIVPHEGKYVLVLPNPEPLR